MALTLSLENLQVETFVPDGNEWVEPASTSSMAPTYVGCTCGCGTYDGCDTGGGMCTKPCVG